MIRDGLSAGELRNMKEPSIRLSQVEEKRAQATVGGEPLQQECLERRDEN